MAPEYEEEEKVAGNLKVQKPDIRRTSRRHAILQSSFQNYINFTNYVETINFRGSFFT